jgi:hypothetical protein
MASAPAAVMWSSTPRPSGSGRFRQMVFIAASALRGLLVTYSRIRPRARSAATTWVAAPPRSEPGSGSTLPSARCAAAERMIDWVSESLDIGWYPFH